MIRALFRFLSRKPSLIDQAKAQYHAAHAAYEDAVLRNDSRDKSRFMAQQCVALRTLMTLEVRR